MSGQTSVLRHQRRHRRQIDLLGDAGLASEKWRALSVKEEVSDGRTQEAVHT